MRTHNFIKILEILFCQIPFFIASNAFAQVNMNGKIVFEKRQNQHALIENSTMDQSMINQFKTNFEKILVTKFELSFDSLRSTYQLMPSPVNVSTFLPPSRDTDFVYKNFNTSQILVQRDAMGTNYVFMDSLQGYKWKILDETRMIAGFECKKALTIIHDNVYVVAFFTTEIGLSSGPECFNGLPGMILEIAIPQIYTNWIAISVDATKKDIEEKHSQKPPITRSEYFNEIQKAGRVLPPDAKKILWFFNL